MSTCVYSRNAFNSLRIIKQQSKCLSTAVNLKRKPASSPVLISCKRSELNHYLGTNYGKLEEVPLASKGWNHSKSKHDYFTVLPVPDQSVEETHSFLELGVHTEVIAAMKEYGIKSATDFQFNAAKTIQRGVHTLLAAETGCGKTLAYLLPIIQALLRDSKPRQLNSPRVVVLVPNRELAYQIGDTATTLCDPIGLNVKTLVGGNVKKMMLSPAFDETDVLVATPGALGKLSTVGVYKLGEVEKLVLDEADTLIDDSFIERIESLIKRMSQAQLILVSATLPKKLPDILVPYGETMEQVLSPRLHKPLLNITQKFMRITKTLKPANLLQIVKPSKEPLLVFTNRNQTCKWLAMYLRENGIPCSNISGDMNYAIRIEQWNQFVRGDTKVLSATDIGSRGLNTIQINHVLNYDFPFYAADYIHRIGRVGRIGSPESCKVTNFVTGEQEIKLVQQIELSIRRNQPLTNVDGNITNIVQNKILQKIRKGTQ